MAIENKRMVQLRGNASDWSTNPLTPLEGELCVGLNGTTRPGIKVGDGAMAYADLDFINRRTTAEFDADFATTLAGVATDTSAGGADAGKVVLLDGSGFIDSSMFAVGASGSFRLLGEADFTGAKPAAPPGGGPFLNGDTYVNDTTGLIDGSWNPAGPGPYELDSKPTFFGDYLIYDSVLTSWRFIAGRSTLDLQDRDYADDTAAGVGGVPIGGLYHNSGAVRVRLT